MLHFSRGILISFGFICLSLHGRSTSPLVPDPVLIIPFEDNKGKKWTFTQWVKSIPEEKKVFILATWASFCSPCHQNLEALSRLSQDKELSKNLAILPIAIDPENAKQLWKGPMVSGLNWFQSHVMGAYLVQKNMGIPCVWVLDRQGHILHHMVGLEFQGWDSAAKKRWLTSKIAQLKSKKPQKPLSLLLR